MPCEASTPLATDTRAFVYRVDAAGRIVFANQEWFDFARENKATRLVPSRILGSSLWDFVHDGETRHLLEILLSKVRQSQRRVVLPYRCDSPACRRFMEATVTPISDLQVEFSSRIVRQEFRAPIPLLQPDVKRTGELLMMCSWCKKVRTADQRWVEVEAAIAILNLFDAERLPKISHGICGACCAALEMSLRQGS